MIDKDTQQILELLMEKTEEIGTENVIAMLLQMINGDENNMLFNNRQMFYTRLKEQASRIFEQVDIDFDNNFAVGIRFGGDLDDDEEKRVYSYPRYVLESFIIYNQIEKIFSTYDIGFEVHRTANALNMIGVFPKKHKEDFVDVYLKPLNKMLEDKYKIRMWMGIGMIAENRRQLYNSYRTAEYAHGLYFFYEKRIIDFRTLDIQFEGKTEGYDACLNDALHAILIRDPETVLKIERAIDFIAEIHFGNWRAVLMRIMAFTGDLTSRLLKYKLFRGDFFETQDRLEAKILNAKTLRQAKQYTLDYYSEFLPYIYGNDRMSSKAIVEEVKTYIQDNFMEELSIQKLSEVACVSPNYFSHMFKNEVGQNYKDYLTDIRLKNAVDLILNTDYPLYKIAEAVGYNSTRSFVEAFKKKYQDSPTKYKKKIQKDR